MCPSEVARAVAGGGSSTDDDPEQWRALMEPARMAARRLVAAGRAEITQGGRVVDPSRATGPIRVRRPRRGPPVRCPARTTAPGVGRGHGMEAQPSCIGMRTPRSRATWSAIS